MTDNNMPYMDGIQLATVLRTIPNRKFNITLVSADEIENEENLFNYIFEKPVPLKKIIDIY